MGSPEAPRVPRSPFGGVIHTYQKYDPQRFPSPTQPPPDLVSPAFEHMLMYGNTRRLTPEELARAVKLDPKMIQGMGPSLDAFLMLLRERKRKILEKYETKGVQREARKQFERNAGQINPPEKFEKRFRRAIASEQIHDLQQIWYSVGDDQHPFAQSLVPLMERLGDKYEVDELASKWTFTGREPLTIPEAIAVKEELEKIDRLIEQLEKARETAQIGIIDLDELREFTEPGEIEKLEELGRMVENYLKEMAEQQGIERDGKGFRLTPQAYKVFQAKLLERIFSQLQGSRSGRHQQAVTGEGAVEMPITKQYEFGDSLTQLDIPQSFINALIRNGPGLPIRLGQEDLVVHKTRNTPKCATIVVMDMSGSMRYDGQYMNVKRMALALDGLIHREYPGDYLQFIEMYSFAKLRPRGEIVSLMPKPVTIYDPFVRLKADMSREDLSEIDIPPHFTNMQHALQLSRKLLATQDTPNRQIIVITDGLPTAHFEGSNLYLFYPPDPRTEEATMREGMYCAREGITLNLFLVPSWSQSEEDIRFAYRLAETTKGRVFFTAGRDLDRYVVWDYLSRKREILS